MPYAIQPVAGSWNLFTNHLAGAPSATFRYILVSCWTQAQFANLELNTGTVAGGGFNWFSGFPSMDIKFATAAGSQIVDALWDTSVVPAYTSGNRNFLWSFDTVAQIAQLYVDDVAVLPSSIDWFLSAAAGYNPAIDVILQRVGNTANACIGDVYVDLPAAFYDLSVVLNRRAFIDAAGAPVDLGANGATPTGSQPLVFFSTAKSGGSVGDFVVNKGSIPSYFTSPAPSGLCLVNPTAQLADLWFGETPGFVDLDTVANRRKFIDGSGAPARLGADGSRPFDITPQVLFSRSQGAGADSFAANLGSGGGFTLSGGDLADATSAPACSTEISAVFTPASAGLGVVGDYRNGNLYAFNMATLQDAGSPRKWVRAWRALVKPTDNPVAFGSLLIDMETGKGIVPAVTPAIMLRWSDDGGHTWSQPRLMQLAPLGGTAYRVKANRLGSTRLTSGLDRIWELSSRDPFMVALLGAEMDAA